MTVESYLPSGANAANGSFVGARVEDGGCGILTSKGIFFFILLENQTAVMTTDFGKFFLLIDAMATDCFFKILFEIKNCHSY